MNILYKWLIEIGVFLLVLGGSNLYSYEHGKTVKEKEYAIVVANQNQKIAQLESQSSVITTKVITKYVPKIIHVKDVQHDIQQKIQTQITPTDESSCHLSNNVIGLLNDAATDPTEVSGGTSGVDAKTTQPSKDSR